MPPKGTRVLLARHAESALNITPWIINGRSNHISLSEAGPSQATRLGEVLLSNGLQPDEVRTSPALRTRQTAKLCLAAMRYTGDVVIDERLQELDMGEWTGRNRAEMYTPGAIRQINALGLDARLHGGESMRQVGDRMYDALPADENTPTVNLYFTHGVAIRSLVGRLLNWSHQQIHQVQTNNASLTGLSYHDSWQVDFINFDPAVQTEPPQST